MEIIPLISIRKKKLWAEQEEKILSLHDIKKRIKTDTKLYIMDYDGKEKNIPNLDLFHQLTEYYTLWIDCSPRTIDDVIDAVIAGASIITLRSTHWPDMDIPTIKEVTESELYATINLLHTTPNTLNTSLFYEINGILLLNNKEQIETNYTLGSHLKTLTTTHKLYTFESQPEHVSYWQQKGASGIIADINTYKEFPPP